MNVDQWSPFQTGSRGRRENVNFPFFLRSTLTIDVFVMSEMDTIVYSVTFRLYVICNLFKMVYLFEKPL